MVNEYQEIDLGKFIHMILRKWWLLSLLSIISAITVYMITDYHSVPTYTARTSLFIGKESNKIGGISIGDLQLNNQLINDYRQLVKSRMVVEDVINSLNINMSHDTLRGNLYINTIKDSRLFTINFRHTNPELAADIANEVGRVLVKKVSEIVDVENIQVIDTALVPVTPIVASKVKNAIIGGIIGIILAVFIIILMDLLDNTIKTEEESEKQLGLPAIGVIPKFKGGGR